MKKKSVLTEYEFDQFQRYSLLRRLLYCVYDISDEEKERQVTLFDVGAGPSGLTETFLGPVFEITSADVEQFDNPEIMEIKPGQPFEMPDNSVDTVLSLEVLEHVPPEQRTLHINECLRVSRDVTIISCPVNTQAAAAAEKRINDIYQSMAGQDHPFLVEHIQNGLPDPDEIRGCIEQSGSLFLEMSNLHMADWEAFFLSDILLSTLPDGQEFIRTIHDVENNRYRCCYKDGPHYRRFFVVAKNQNVLKSLMDFQQRFQEETQFFSSPDRVDRRISDVFKELIDLVDMSQRSQVRSALAACLFRVHRLPLVDRVMKKWTRVRSLPMAYDVFDEYQDFQPPGAAGLPLVMNSERKSVRIRSNFHVKPYLISFWVFSPESAEIEVVCGDTSVVQKISGGRIREMSVEIQPAVSCKELILSLKCNGATVVIGDICVRKKSTHRFLSGIICRASCKSRVVNSLCVFFRKKYHLEVEPIEDVRPDPNVKCGWICSGAAPSFQLEGVFPTGWVKIRKPRKCKGADVIRLLFDMGDGRYSKYCRVITFSDMNRCRVFVHVENVANMRIDLLDAQERFVLSNMVLQKISLYEILFVAYCRRFKENIGHRTSLNFIFRTMKLLLCLNMDEYRRKAKKLTRDMIVDPGSSYQVWLDNNRVYTAQLRKMEERIKTFTYYPVFSILIPVYNVDEHWLTACLDSILTQLYPHFEVCLADDASPKPHVRRVLERYKARDRRIKVIYRKENGNISAATNSALELATGDYICLMDNDDEIPSNALYEFAVLLNQDPDIDMIYSDEDKIDVKGQRYEPFFKPDWSPEYLESCMYTAHFACYRFSIYKDVNGMRTGYEGAQDFDFVLRFTELAQKIVHIPKVLYHWRAIPGSTALQMKEKQYVLDAAIRGLQDRVARKYKSGRVRNSVYEGCFNIHYDLQDTPLVSIIIPSAGRMGTVRNKEVDLLARCIRFIREKSTYTNYEIIVVDNNDLRSSTQKAIAGDVKEFVHFDGTFNVAKKMNLGAQAVSGEFLLFLNDDIEVITSEWIEALLGLGQQDGIGVVGPKLLYGNNTIQHAGVSFTNGLPDHVFRGYAEHFPGYYFNVCGFRNYMAVTGACLLTRQSIFHDINGFNEDFAINYNDIDYCLRVHEAGYRIVYTPLATLYHFESLNREASVEQKEIDLFLKLWKQKTYQDPYYNPNLEVYPPNFEIKNTDPMFTLRKGKT